MPFLGFNKSIGSIIGGLVLHGLGLGSEVVSGFADAHKSALTAGFPDTIDTYGLVSGLLTSTFALGAALLSDMILVKKKSELPEQKAF